MGSYTSREELAPMSARRRGRGTYAGKKRGLSVFLVLRRGQGESFRWKKGDGWRGRRAGMSSEKKCPAKGVYGNGLCRRNATGKRNKKGRTGWKLEGHTIG